jgi:hypothetical protein
LSPSRKTPRTSRPWPRACSSCEPRVPQPPTPGTLVSFLSCDAPRPEQAHNPAASPGLVLRWWPTRIIAGRRPFPRRLSWPRWPRADRISRAPTSSRSSSPECRRQSAAMPPLPGPSVPHGHSLRTASIFVLPVARQFTRSG